MVYFNQPGLLNPSHINLKAGDFNVMIFQHPTAFIEVKYAHYFFISASTFILSVAASKKTETFLSPSLLRCSLMITALAISYVYRDYNFLLFGWFLIFPFAIAPINKYFILERRELNKSGKKIKLPIEWVIQ